MSNTSHFILETAFPHKHLSFRNDCRPSLDLYPRQQEQAARRAAAAAGLCNTHNANCDQEHLNTSNGLSQYDQTEASLALALQKAPPPAAAAAGAAWRATTCSAVRRCTS